MKALILSLLVISTQASFAEGVASMTDVTAANRTSLKHHSLAVACTSQHGRTFVDLVFRADKETPFEVCDVTIYDRDGKKILVAFEAKVEHAPKAKGVPDGSRVYFDVADELLDGVQVRYHLFANDVQSHVFTINPGQLRPLSKN